MSGRPDAPVRLIGRWTSASGRAMHATCPLLQTLFTGSQRSSVDRTLQHELTGRSNPSVRSFPVRSPRRISSTERVRSTLTGHRSASGAIPSALRRPVSLTGHTLPGSGAFRPSVRSVDRRQRLRDQLVFTSNFFTLAPMSQPQEFASVAIENRHSIFPKAPNPSHPCKHHLLCKCANTTKCTPPCVCVLAFSQSFPKGC